MNEIEQVSLGVIIGAGLLVWLVIAVAMADRRRNDKKPDDEKPQD